MFTATTVTKRELLSSYEEGTTFEAALAGWLNKAHSEGFEPVSVETNAEGVLVVFKSPDKPKK